MKNIAKKIAVSVWLTALGLGAARCAGPRAGEPAPFRSGRCEEGTASFYADKFTGRRTASGERYDPRVFTAAHRHYPFGTRLSVERQGRAVDVRVNDRGPFYPGAVIDLSRSAAERLGIVRLGRAEVRVCPVSGQ